MSGWETLVAALGGLSVGTGLGILLGRRGEERLRRHVSHLHSRTRSTVLPVLERRAQALDLPASERHVDSKDPMEMALVLSERVLRAEEKQALPFSDTVEFTAGSFSKSEETAPEEENSVE